MHLCQIPLISLKRDWWEVAAAEEGVNLFFLFYASLSICSSERNVGSAYKG